MSQNCDGPGAPSSIFHPQSPPLPPTPPLRGGGQPAQPRTAPEPAIAPLYKGGARGDEPLALGSDKKLSGLQSWHPVSPLCTPTSTGTGCFGPAAARGDDH